MQEDSCRNSFIKKLGDLFDRIIQYGPVDAAVDQVSDGICTFSAFANARSSVQMAIQHIHSCLPPLITTGKLCACQCACAGWKIGFSLEFRGEKAWGVGEGELMEEWSGEARDRDYWGL